MRREREESVLWERERRVEVEERGGWKKKGLSVPGWHGNVKEGPGAKRDSARAYQGGMGM